MKKIDDIGLLFGKFMVDMEDPFFLEALMGSHMKVSFASDSLGIVVAKNWHEIRNESGEICQFVPGLVNMEESTIQFALFKGHDQAVGIVCDLSQVAGDKKGFSKCAKKF